MEMGLYFKLTNELPSLENNPLNFYDLVLCDKQLNNKKLTHLKLYIIRIFRYIRYVFTYRTFAKPLNRLSQLKQLY